MKFSATDLILNADGSVFHLHLTPDMVSDKIIMVGDPDRVKRVSRYFDKIEVKRSHREFVTHTGTFQGKRITVISTGIGTDNVEIVFSELDALFNTDLKRREVKKKKRSASFVRVGTSGSLRKEIEIGTHLYSASAIGLDELIAFYAFKSSIRDLQLCSALQAHTGLPARPYLSRGSSKLIRQMTDGMTAGNTVTCPGFYAPQGRKLRIPTRFPRLLHDLSRFDYDGYQLTNFEMETSGLYALAELYGHEALSLNAIIAGRAVGKFAAHPEKIIDALILMGLERI
jgi:uridine phosphorylase